MPKKNTKNRKYKNCLNLSDVYTNKHVCRSRGDHWWSDVVGWL